MNIYFHIDELNRDAIIASVLEKKFTQKGHNFIFGNRTSNPLLNLFHDAFDIIVMPRPHFLYDNWGSDCLSWNSKFVMLSAENLGIICKDHHVMARTILEDTYFNNDQRFTDKIDAFCLWGEKQLQAIKDYAYTLQEKCHVIGHPRHDISCKNFSLTKYTKKKIGFITRANSINDYFGRSLLESFQTLFDDHFQYEYINKITGEKLISKRPGARPVENAVVQCIDVENSLNIIKIFEKKGYEVTIRCHPKEDLLEWKKLFDKCSIKAEIADNNLPITEWLKSVRIIIGPPSTAFYDAVMSGVEPISISNLDERRKKCIGELWEDNNRLMDHIYKPQNIEELVNYVESKSSFNISSEIKDILKSEANYPECKHSLRVFVSVCENLTLIKSKRRVSLILFYLARWFYTKAWTFKNLIIKRKETSASFAMSNKTILYIRNFTK